MIQLRLLLLGLTVIGSIGYAVYSHYKNQEQHQQHSYGSRRRRRSSTGNDTEGPSDTSEPPTSRMRTAIAQAKTTCSICLVTVGKDGRNLTCGHRFHQNCIQMWFNSEKTCPNCRAKVL